MIDPKRESDFGGSAKRPPPTKAKDKLRQTYRAGGTGDETESEVADVLRK